VQYLECAMSASGGI